MKFKIASILELVIPLSILVALSLSACGGGGAYGSGTGAYDGTWSLNLKGYTLPAPLVSGDTVSCSERFTTVTITHGSGSTTEILDCINAPSPTYNIDIGVTLTPAASGITGTVKVITTGGGTGGGTCIDRLTCEGPGLSMYKCGTPASGC